MKFKDILKRIGPSFVSLGLGLGSGEFILWPYLTSGFGFGILWGAVIGIMFQVILNIYIQKYSIQSRKSLSSGIMGISKWFGIWIVLSTIIGFGWPGFVSSAGYLINNGFGIDSNSVIISISFLFLLGLILILSKKAYSVIERIIKIFMPISFVIILFLFVYFFDIQYIQEMFKGIVGIGNGYSFIPLGLSISTFFGAIIYSGSGGNLLLSQSNYILEKGVEKEKKEFKFQIFENIFLFGIMGIITIFMLAYLGYVLTISAESQLPDLSFLIYQSDVIKSSLGILFKYLYLFTGIVALLSVQFGVLDLTGRVTSDVLSELGVKKKELMYRFGVGAIVITGILIFLFGFNQPLWLITIGAIFNSLAMAFISSMVLYLNLKVEKEWKNSLFETFVLSLISILYLLFFVFSVISII